MTWLTAMTSCCLMRKRDRSISQSCKICMIEKYLVFNTLQNTV